MTASADHYEVLGVDREADEREIKRSFYRLLKEYPPEQKPTEYKRLREAYDTLSDPASRKEYDGLSEFGDEIAALRDEAEALMNAEPPDYNGAVRALKKAVVLGPEIGYLRNQLGQCLLQGERPEHALKQFRRASEINPANDAFLLNVGRAQRDTGDARGAEGTFREVWSRDEEDYEAPRALASLLFEQGRKREAHEVLDRAIGADGKVDFQDFFCLWDKLHLYLFGGDHDELPGMLDTIRHVAKAEADRKYAAFMLADAAGFLVEAKAYDKADLFLRSARELAPDEEGVREFADSVGEVAGLDTALQDVLDDDSYHFLVQELVRIRLAVHLNYIDEATGQGQFNEILGVGDTVMQTDPAATEAKASVRRVRREHPAAAALLEELFDLIAGAPAAVRFMSPCPYCGDNVVVEKWDTGKIGCPHCYQKFRFDGERYRRRDEPRSRSSADRPPAPQPTTAAPNRSAASTTKGEGNGGMVYVWITIGVLAAFGMCGVAGSFSGSEGSGSTTYGSGPDDTWDRGDPVEESMWQDPVSEPARRFGQDDDYDTYGFSPRRGVNRGLISRDRREVRVRVPDGERLSLRHVPSARHGERVDRIPDGMALVLTGCLPPRPEDGARWCQTSYGGVRGWVYDLYVQTEQAYQEETREREARAYALGYSPRRGVNRSLIRPVDRTVRVAVPEGRPLPLRDAPSGEHGTPIHDVPGGAILHLSSCLPDRPEDGGRWCHTAYGGRAGWVYDRYLVALGAAAHTEAERIRFGYMATSATVSGSVSPGSTARYVLHLKAGQRVAVVVVHGATALDVSARPPRKAGERAASLFSTSSTAPAKWRGTVPDTGDYEIELRARSRRVQFDLTVSAE